MIKLTIVLKGLTNHVAHLDVDLRGEIAAVSTKLSEESASVPKEISAVRTEVKTEINDLRNDVNKRFEKLETDITDIKDVRKEVIYIHKALNGQVLKIVGALSLLWYESVNCFV